MLKNARKTMVLLFCIICIYTCILYIYTHTYIHIYTYIYEINGAVLNSRAMKIGKQPDPRKFQKEAWNEQVMNKRRKKNQCIFQVGYL